MAKEEKKKATLPPELAKEGVGMHRKPNCVEIVMAQTGKPFLKVNEVVKVMTADEKKDVDTKDKGKVAAAYAAANTRLLEKNKATESETP